MILCVIFIVLMMFWLFYGYTYRDQARPGSLGFTIIPWLCVAILGWEIFKGVR